VNPFLATAAFLSASLTAVWALSVRRKDTSIVDIAWGPAVASGAVVHLVLAGPPVGARAGLATVLGTAWALRLAAYLWVRARGRPEDARYAAMRAEHGERWALRSLVTVFQLQAALAWVISLPLQFAAGSRGGLGAWDVTGAVVALAGITFEAVADEQLRGFKRSAPAGSVMDKGLWRYSRHPNYFGECVTAWGLYLLAVGAGHGLAALAGPAVLTFLLLRVSGVTLLEKHLESRPGYADYVARTSPFFPWPPRSMGTPGSARTP
jgi:steroid 5-alpha reductase family enzyme